MSEVSSLIRRNIASELLAKAQECEARATHLGKSAGSTDRICADVWRAAATIAWMDVVKENQP